MAVNLLTIEDSTIKAMLADPRVVALLPCLDGTRKALASTSPGGRDCQRCKAEKKGIIENAMRAAKSCIVSNARGASLQELKTLLGARQLRLHVRNASGKKTIYTI